MPFDIAGFIDIEREQLLSISDASKELHGHPCNCTIFRWFNRGVHGIRLASVCIGGRRYTSRQALERFCTEVTAATDGKRPTTRTPARRHREIEGAEREMNANTKN